MVDSTYVAPATAAENAGQGMVMVRAEHVHVRYRVYEDVKQTLRAAVASAGRRRRFREVHAVNDISFEAHAGEVIGVIGPNGSGKTTLMRAIAGLLPVDEGAVYARATPMLLGVGAILNKTLSGRRNIMLGGLALGLTREEVLAREKEIIDFSGIGHSINLPMKTYSSGMSARLQFAISAAVKPDILIIDEALSVGDRDFKQRSRKRIEELRESAGTVFLVSHSMASIRKSCTRALWLDDGVLRMEGEPEDVIEAYNDSDQRQENRAQRRQRQRAKAERILTRLKSQEEDPDFDINEPEIAASRTRQRDKAERILRRLSRNEPDQVAAAARDEEIVAEVRQRKREKAERTLERIAQKESDPSTSSINDPVKAERRQRRRQEAEELLKRLDRQEADRAAEDKEDAGRLDVPS